MNSGDDLTTTAWHEAGHAVVAIYFGLPFFEVTIVPSEGADGHVSHPTPLGIDFGFADTPAERRRCARQQILSDYAGLEAARLIHPEASEDSGEHDRNKAMAASCLYQVLPRRHNGLVIGGEHHREFLDRLRGEARRLVRRLREPIRVLARELLDRATMNQAEAERAIRHLLEPGQGNEREDQSDPDPDPGDAP